MLSNRNPLVLIGTYTEREESKSEGIYVYRMDPSSGQLSYETVIRDMPNVSYMAVHPQTGSFYTVSETEEFEGKPGGGVNVLSRDPAGNFTVLSKQSSGGVDPAYISVEPTGRFAFVANYTSGSVAVLPIDSDGRLRPATDVIQHVGCSVHPERQNGPHPHCVMPDPANRFVIAVDLGLDKLLIYRLDFEAGKLQKHGEVEVDACAGPRHLVFSSNGQFAYLLNELNSTLIAYQYDAILGVFTRLQTVSTLPDDFSGENYCSDLHLSLDEKHLYISNRRHDSLVCFKVHTGSGELTYQSHIPSYGREPRIFAIDPSGRFIVAVHQKSRNAVVYRIDLETANLSHTGYEVQVDMPVHVLIVQA